MIIRTSQDVALVGGGCCALPSCEAPRKECESISAALTTVGFFKAADTEWKIYSVRENITTYAYSVSTTAYRADYGTFVDYEYDVSAENIIRGSYDATFHGSIGSGDGCTEWVATLTTECTATGTSTQSNYSVQSASTSSTTYGYEYLNDLLVVVTVEDISGHAIPSSDPPATYPPCSFRKKRVHTANDWVLWNYNDPTGYGLINYGPTVT